MFDTLRSRIQQKHRTIPFPDPPPALPARFRGRLKVDAARCPDGCRVCVESCPTDAISINGSGPKIDLGRCIFCTECVSACPEKAISFTPEFRMAVRSRQDLVIDGEEQRLAEALDGKMRSLFGRSLRLRQVSAGGCAGCEVEVNATSNVVFDTSRFGIQFVASPRHADGLLITGPVTQNMELALRKTYDAVPPPKLVIAAGACAISGGVFRDHAEVRNGAESVVPVDLYIPGCPPHPLTILDGLLRLLGRIDQARA